MKHKYYLKEKAVFKNMRVGYCTQNNIYINIKEGLLALALCNLVIRGYQLENSGRIKCHCIICEFKTMGIAVWISNFRLLNSLHS